MTCAALLTPRSHITTHQLQSVINKCKCWLSSHCKWCNIPYKTMYLTYLDQRHHLKTQPSQLNQHLLQKSAHLQRSFVPFVSCSQAGDCISSHPGLKSKECGFPVCGVTLTKKQDLLIIRACHNNMNCWDWPMMSLDDTCQSDVSVSRQPQHPNQPIDHPLRTTLGCFW